MILKVMSQSLEKIIESIQELPAPEREKVRQWLENRRPANGEGQAGSGNGARAEKSLRWLRENRQKFLGQWVALEGDRLISSGRTASEVYAKAKADGVRVPFVELVTPDDLSPFSGGWLS
jgi:hypothetical protein